MKVGETNIMDNGKIHCPQCQSLFDVDGETEMDSLKLYCPQCRYFCGSVA